MAEKNDSGIEQIQLLDGIQDSYGGVTVEMKDHMDADVFAPLLRASISSWKQLVLNSYFIGLVTFFFFRFVSIPLCSTVFLLIGYLLVAGEEGRVDQIAH